MIIEVSEWVIFPIVVLGLFLYGAFWAFLDNEPTIAKVIFWRGLALFFCTLFAGFIGHVVGVDAQQAICAQTIQSIEKDKPPKVGLTNPAE